MVNAEKITHRVCPACRKPITQYTYSSILLPFESFAVKRINETKDLGGAFPVFPFDHASLRQWFRIVLSSECECGHISFWRADFQELLDSFNDQDNPNILHFEILQTYLKEEVERRIALTEDKGIKESMEQLLKMFS